MQHNEVIEKEGISPLILPSSGTIWMSQVNTELGRSSNNPITLGESSVRNLAGDTSGHIAMSQLHGKAAELHKSLNTTTSTKYAIENLFSTAERTGKHCVLTVTGGKIGGGDRSTGSLYSNVSDWHKLTVIINSGAKIIGKGGAGEAYTNSACSGRKQNRTDGGHAITFKSGSNCYVEIRSGGQVSGGGSGGNAGWRVACGYSNSGTGGAGGGGAGYPAGLGGQAGSQVGSSCYCSTTNYAKDGTETAGGDYGRATGWGNGCSPNSTAAAQHGSRGGGLGQKASRTDGCYPIGAHGNGGSSVVGAKAVRASRSSTIHGDICQWEDLVETIDNTPRVVAWVGDGTSDIANIPVNQFEQELYDIMSQDDEDCPDCQTILEELSHEI